MAEREASFELVARLQAGGEVATVTARDRPGALERGGVAAHVLSVALARVAQSHEAAQRVTARVRVRVFVFPVDDPKRTPAREVERRAAAGDRLDELVATLRQNYAALYRNMLGIDGWIAVFEQSVVVVPLVLCAPRLLDPSLDLTLGQLVQLLAVFQRVFDSLNLPAHNWSTINDFAATVVRLVEFERSVGEAKASELV